MKLHKALVLGLAALLGLAVTQVPVSAFATQREAVRLAAAAYRQNLQRRGYAIAREDAEQLPRGSYAAYPVTLYRGVPYGFVAGGDRNIYDLDLRLYDQQGRLVSRDNLRDSYPVIYYTPRYTGRYILVVLNYSGNQGWYHMAMCVKTR